jgi:hypothetical protein
VAVGECHHPRDRFTVDSAQHGNIGLGVDQSGDGSADEAFGAGVISGVDNNDVSFTIERDTGYTPQAGDILLADYPAVGNPEEAGDCEVELPVNGAQTETVTVTIEYRFQGVLGGGRIGASEPARHRLVVVQLVVST